MQHEDKWFDEWKIRRGRRPRVGTIFSSSRPDKIAGSSSGGRAPNPHFRLSVSVKSRAKGESAVAAAAYRAGDILVDERTGLTHDYRRKQRVEFSEIVAPAGAPSWAYDRSILWNEAEKNEIKRNARVAREWQISIPRGLSELQAISLARELSHEIAERHQIVVDFSIHKDDPKNFDGSEKGYVSYHAHLLATTRRITLDGFGKKTRELDDKRQGPEEIKFWRERYAALANHALQKAGIEARVDHRSYLARGIDKLPQPKLGSALTQIFRRDKSKLETSVVVDRWEEAAEIRQLQFKQAAIKKELEPVGLGGVTHEKVVAEAERLHPGNQSRQHEFIFLTMIAAIDREALRPGISEERKALLAEGKAVFQEKLERVLQHRPQVAKPSSEKDGSERRDPGRREDKGKER
ncbi:MAG: MobQ family relaxase [Burkholderiales bacterium]